MKYGCSTECGSMSRQIHSADGAPRPSCECRRQHRRLRRSGAVPCLWASPPWSTSAAREALEVVILGRDDLAATNREASADSTLRTRAAQADNTASASTIMSASTITDMNSAPPQAERRESRIAISA
jgi:hypothetical protein